MLLQDGLDLYFSQRRDFSKNRYCHKPDFFRFKTSYNFDCAFSIKSLKIQTLCSDMFAGLCMLAEFCQLITFFVKITPNERFQSLFPTR
jgi:hypothetical protein